MILSDWQVEFVTAAGTRRLVDFGDLIEREPVPSPKQATSQWAEIHSPWGGAAAHGGATCEVRIAVRLSHPTPGAMRDHCMLAAGTLQSGQTGTLRLAVRDGATWEMGDCVIAASDCQPLSQAAWFETLHSFSVTGGRPVPVTPISLYPGVPVEFILQPVEELTLPVESY